MKSKLVLATLGPAVLLAIPAAATASTTVGAPLEAMAPDSWQPGTMIAQRREANVGGALYGGFPTGGVLTSVSVETQGDAADIVVSLLRKTAEPTASTATFLSIGSVTIAVPNHPGWDGIVTTAATRIPVLLGDRFAATTALANTRYLDDWTAAESNYCFYSGSPNPVGTSVTYASTSCNNYIPLVRGVIEPDADGDGFGDESQDLCPTDAARQAACPAALPPVLTPPSIAMEAVRQTGKIASQRSVNFVLKNSGQTAATLVPFSIKSSKAVRHLRIVKGCKPRKSGRTCVIPSIGPGQSLTIKVTLSVKSALKTTLTARSGALKATSTVKFKAKKK